MAYVAAEVKHPQRNISRALLLGTLAGVFSQNAGRFVSILICISTLGAVNGLIFTGARISYALGTEHKFFGLLGHGTDALAHRSGR
jgi:APA family basic amino acid/polyamine antiporter